MACDFSLPKLCECPDIKACFLTPAGLYEGFVSKKGLYALCLEWVAAGNTLTYDIQIYRICHLSVKCLGLKPEQSTTVSIYYRLMILLENKNVKTKIKKILGI